MSSTSATELFRKAIKSFCEIVDITRIKSERTVGRKSIKSVDVDFLSGPQRTCVHIPKLERWKHRNKLRNPKQLLPSVYSLDYFCFEIGFGSNLSQNEFELFNY